MRTFGRDELLAFLHPAILKLQFLHIIERLFGPESARKVGAKGRPKAKQRGSDRL